MASPRKNRPRVCFIGTASGDAATYGGATANMVAVWQIHGVDEVLRRAWERGVILCGISAGAMCWFEAGPTDSLGPDLAPMHDVLEVVANRRGIAAHRVELRDGEVVETRIEPRLLGRGT